MEILAKLFIPKNTPYCHHSFKPNKKYDMSAKPCRYFTYKYNKEWGCKAQYCKYLKDFLSIQDQVKDCGINECEEVKNNENKSI